MSSGGKRKRTAIDYGPGGRDKRPPGGREGGLFGPDRPATAPRRRILPRGGSGPRADHFPHDGDARPYVAPRGAGVGQTAGPRESVGQADGGAGSIRFASPHFRPDG